MIEIDEEFGFLVADVQRERSFSIETCCFGLKYSR